MRRVILSMMVSLDGMIAKSDGDLEWFLTDDQLESEMLELLKDVDGYLFGRVAYQLLSQYWPTAGKSDEEAPGGFTSKEREIEFARLMNEKPKIVFSRSSPELSWKPAQLVSGDLAAEVARLKAQPGKDLALFAGASIAGAFMNLDLVDEYRLMVHPIALGKGLPLFGDLTAERRFALHSARTLPSGVVLLRYERDEKA